MVQKKQEGSSGCTTRGFSGLFYVFVALLFVVIRVFIVAICPVVSPVYEPWLFGASFFFSLLLLYYCNMIPVFPDSFQ